MRQAALEVRRKSRFLEVTYSSHVILGFGMIAKCDAKAETP
jgi:hypothetical protein